MLALNRRNTLAGLLFIVIAAAMASDYLATLYRSSYQLFYFASLIAIITLTLLWLFADAKFRAADKPSNLAYVATIIFTPLGVAIYFFQSRPVKQAIISLFVALLFVILAAMIGDELGWHLFNYLRNAR